MSMSPESDFSAKRYATFEERYAAISSRDGAADGLFFYAVRTTGVYCRPSCAARLARRENVVFYTSTMAAERAGFRACKRCQPNSRSVDDEHIAKVELACRALESAERAPSLSSLAKVAGMSEFHFHRVFRKHVGLTPKAYAKAKRAERMRAALMISPSVTDALYTAGYNASGRFYAESKAMLGMKPKRVRSGGNGERIHFAVGEAKLGTVLVASSERGVCAILMGNEPHVLIDDLQSRFPKAELVGGDAQYESVVAQVVGFVDAPTLSLELPLDIRGTAFQQRVWVALQRIPPGKTLTYTEVAEAIGAPAAVRAVAGACAANALAVAIPCHRVIRTDGSLSGYRWGIERKRALLETEARGNG